MAQHSKDFYELFGLPRSASQDEIRRAYLKAAKRLHPDRNVLPGETEMFQEIHEAYLILSNPVRRSEYNATLPQEKKIPSAVNQQLLVSRKSLSQFAETQLVYVLIDLAPSTEIAQSERSAPLNICLVLDCSTSMKGDKLETVKASAIQLINKLKPQDIFSVVTFNDRAEVAIPATRQANTLKMENRLRLLQTSGGTEILQGLKTGFDEVNRYYSPKYINHIILLTDGHTYGDEQACYELAKEAAKIGIGISGLGIGNGWKDAFLDKLANLTGGHSMLVSEPQDIERLLNEKFLTLSNTYAESVTLDYTLGPGVEINYAFRLQPETDPLIFENPIRLGPILHSWPLSILIEFVIHAQNFSDEFLELLSGKLEISSSNFDKPISDIPVNIVLPIRETGALDTPPPQLIQALSKLTLYRMQEKARNEVAAGNFNKATEHLQRLATHLLSQGERSLAQTVMLEIQNIEKEQSYTEHGEKQIKYGTRALMLPEERES